MDGCVCERGERERDGGMTIMRMMMIKREKKEK